MLAEYACANGMIPHGALVLAAVSGGPDSMCMLHILKELAPSAGFSVAAAHFDHRLRGSESDGDREFVERWCTENGIRLYVGHGDVKAQAEASGCGTEETARRMRYAFLGETAAAAGADVIATAHTADDNCETVIMNIVRGSGTGGVGGIPPVRGNIVRPLLFASRGDVMNYIAENGIPYRTDSTNLCDDYTRNRIRHSVMPVLKEINPALCGHISSLSQLAREDDQYLSSLADDFIEREFDGGALDISALLSLPYPVASRVIRRLVPGAGRNHTDAVLALCKSPSPSAEADVPGMKIRREYSSLIFGAQSSCAFEPFAIEPGQKTDIPAAGLRVSCEYADGAADIYNSLTTYLIDPVKIQGVLTVRPRAQGDSIKLLGRRGTRTLRRLFIDSRIPAARRELIPVAADGEGPVAIYGFGVAERAAAHGGPVLKITFEEINNG